MEIEISRGCSKSLALELSTEKCIHSVEGFEFCITVATNVETEKKSSNKVSALIYKNQNTLKFTFISMTGITILLSLH